MSTWTSDAPPPEVRITSAGWARVAWRGLAIGVVTYGGLVLLLLLRLVEAPFFGLRRPITPYITQGVCISALRLMGLRLVIHGRPMAEPGAIVANHGSWLDIFTLNAAQRIYFVSKSEVANWPGIGWLARATGTVFIDRKTSAARAQKELFENRLHAGHRLLFFPEGTSSDSIRVLPFKSTLFAAFFADGLREHLHLQPVSVTYRAPDGADPRHYGWWGEMEFGAHLLQTLATASQGSVEVTFHPPVEVAAFHDRKQLARFSENVVRAGHERPGALTDQPSA